MRVFADLCERDLENLRQPRMMAWIGEDEALRMKAGGDGQRREDGQQTTGLRLKTLHPAP
jgi:hypothetical protein